MALLSSQSSSRPRFGNLTWRQSGTAIACATGLWLGGGAVPALGQSQTTTPPNVEPTVTEPLFEATPTPEPSPESPASDPLAETAPSDSVPPETAPLPAVTPRPNPQLPGANTTTPAPLPFSPLPGTAQTRDFDTYRLGPGDSFFVSVPRFPELSFQATLDIQGNVIVPLEGAVTFNGLTLAQAEARIAQIYDQYVVSPRVNITLVAQRGVEVTILGEVVRPGYYPLGAPQISTALLTAGGTTGRADLRAVRIQRQLFNGEYIEDTIDLFTPLKEGFSLPDVALQDGDVIVVERLDPGELDEYDQALVSRSTLAQAQIVIRVLNYGAGGGRGSALTTVALPNGSRFIDAIANGGVSPDSTNIGQIALIRFDEEAGQAVTTVLDGGAAFRGDPVQNPPLQHNDVIIMNRTFLARLTYGLNTFTQPFRDVLGFLLFFDSLSNSAENLFRP